MTEIKTGEKYQNPQMEADSHQEPHSPGSPYRQSRDTIDLCFKNLSYTVKIKNPDRKTRQDPKCIKSFA